MGSTTWAKVYTLYICELTVIQQPNSKLIQKVCEMARPNQLRTFNRNLYYRQTRARVNKCLNELKSLIAKHLQPESLARLTNADVLELAVTHLKKLQSRNQPIPNDQDVFRGGCYRWGSLVSHSPASVPSISLTYHEKHPPLSILMPQPLSTYSSGYSSAGALSPSTSSSPSHNVSTASSISSNTSRSSNISKSSNTSPHPQGLPKPTTSSPMWRPW